MHRRSARVRASPALLSASESTIAEWAPASTMHRPIASTSSWGCTITTHLPLRTIARTDTSSEYFVDDAATMRCSSPRPEWYPESKTAAGRSPLPWVSGRNASRGRQMHFGGRRWQTASLSPYKPRALQRKLPRRPESPYRRSVFAVDRSPHGLGQGPPVTAHPCAFPPGSWTRTGLDVGWQCPPPF